LVVVGALDFAVVRNKFRWGFVGLVLDEFLLRQIRSDSLLVASGCFGDCWCWLEVMSWGCGGEMLFGLWLGFWVVVVTATVLPLFSGDRCGSGYW
jgi:hypothetical protein